jgi:NAD(P)-dependent dehydrogenase (short-subunit alcohol dehydrogenase family)
MSTSNIPSDTEAVVVGASRGLGRGIASALADTGRQVIAVARSADALAELAREQVGITPAVADAADRATAQELLSEHRPGVLVLVAGAVPPILPLQQHTWETFSVNWNSDVRVAFEWLRETLVHPLTPGSKVIVMSSGAALQGSPLSGGYAGAKAAQRFITTYAQDEANRAGLGITYTTILPAITPLGSVGRPAVTAYAERLGITEEGYLGRFGPLLTPEIAGAAVADLLDTEASNIAPAYRLNGGGLHVLG